MFSVGRLRAFEQLGDWPPTITAVAVLHRGEAVTAGQIRHQFHLASVTKALFAYAVLVAVEEGSLSFDQTVEHPDVGEGATVAHLLSHSSGLSPEQRGATEASGLARPGQRRIYSNYGFELLGQMLEDSTRITAADYLNEAVTAPLTMSDTVLNGSPAHGGYSTVADLARFAAELLEPSLISRSTLATATTPFLGDLPGVLPGYGLQKPNPWGLGFEVRGNKTPHWTGAVNSAATFGHFGRSGTFLWVDPLVEVACVALTNQDFGPWAAKAWPPFSDTVLKELGFEGTETRES